MITPGQRFRKGTATATIVAIWRGGADEWVQLRISRRGRDVTPATLNPVRIVGRPAHIPLLAVLADLVP